MAGEKPCLQQRRHAEHDRPFDGAMTPSLLLAFLIGGQHGAAPGFAEQHGVARALLEIIGGELSPIDEIQSDAIGQERAELLHQIERERRPTGAQRDEIATIQNWLRARGLPDSSGHHHGMTPGMLTPAELDQLRSARDSAFDRLFLTFMIRHHEGALVMVSRLFASPGAAQEPELAGFANEVNADQQAEIRRMRQLLEISQ